MHKLKKFRHFLDVGVLVWSLNARIASEFVSISAFC